MSTVKLEMTIRILADKEHKGAEIEIAGRKYELVKVAFGWDCNRVGAEDTNDEENSLAGLSLEKIQDAAYEIMDIAQLVARREAKPQPWRTLKDGTIEDLDSGYTDIDDDGDIDD